MSFALEIAQRSGEGWKSGPIGLAVILLLCVAVYFLFKSMSKHLKKVREEFPTDDPPAAAPAATDTAATSAADVSARPAPTDDA